MRCRKMIRLPPSSKIQIAARETKSIYTFTNLTTSVANQICKHSKIRTIHLCALVKQNLDVRVIAPDWTAAHFNRVQDSFVLVMQSHTCSQTQVVHTLREAMHVCMPYCVASCCAARPLVLQTLCECEP